MKRFSISLLASVFGFLASISIVYAETLIDTTHDSRVIVAFKVADEAVQAWLPDGWSVTPFEKGPLAGSNLLVVFHDRHLILDPDGNQSVVRGLRQHRISRYDQESTGICRVPDRMGNLMNRLRF